MHDIEQRRRFSEQLPFYINGTLGGTDRDWMQQYMDAHLDAQREFRFESLLCETTKNVDSQVPEAERVNQLLGEWHRVRPQRSWWNRWLELQWIAGDYGAGARIAIPVPALAVLGALVVGQAVFFGSKALVEPQTNAYRSVAIPCLGENQIRVVFKPDSKNVDTVILLRTLEAHLIAGPSETGEIWIALPSTAAQTQALTTLQSSPLIESAVVSMPSQNSTDCKK
jgi:hypothetical protein